MCGPMRWAFDVQEGVRRLGHDCWVICSTKSGKVRKSWGAPQSSGGGRWWTREPDIVARHDELVSYLDAADVVLMPEVKNPVHDADAKRDGGLPVYVDALRRTTTPWTTGLHASLYEDKVVPYLEDLLESPAMGAGFTLSEFSVRSNPLLEKRAWRHVEMPYVLRTPVDAPAVKLPTVGMMGRFMPNKGPHVGMLAACERLGAGYVYEQWGSSSKGAGCSPTYDVWRMLQEHYEGSAAVRYFKDYEVFPGNKTNPYHWDVRTPRGLLVRYMGNYTDPIATAARLGVHLALTSSKFAGGVVEYATLEAMDAGCMCATPRAFSDERLMAYVLPEYSDVVGMKGTVRDRMDTDVKEVGDAVVGLLSRIAFEPAWCDEVTAYNRRSIQIRNDPARVAADVIECALTKER